MSPIPHVDVKAQYAPLIPELKEAFARTLESGRFIFGPEVEGFEREAAEYLGVEQAIGVANGTDALVLVLDAMGIGPGDEVICPSFTFYATAEAIARVGATPVFAEIDPVTLNLDPADVEQRITPKTKAIMPVHLFGRPAPVAELERFGLPIIEDCRPGVRRRRGSRRASRRPSASSRPRTSSHSATAGCRRQRRGARRADPHAALPRLAREEGVRVRRLQLAPRRAAGGDPAHLPARTSTAGTRRAARRPRGTPSSASARSSSFRPTSRGTSTTCTASARPSAMRLAAALRRKPRSASRQYYEPPLHLQPALRYLGYSEGDFPETEQAARENLCLPMWAGITEEQQARGRRRAPPRVEPRARA